MGGRGRWPRVKAAMYFRVLYTEVTLLRGGNSSTAAEPGLELAGRTSLVADRGTATETPSAGRASVAVPLTAVEPPRRPLWASRRPALHVPRRLLEGVGHNLRGQVQVLPEMLDPFVREEPTPFFFLHPRHHKVSQ